MTTIIYDKFTYISNNAININIHKYCCINCNKYYNFSANNYICTYHDVLVCSNCDKIYGEPNTLKKSYMCIFSIYIKNKIKIFNLIKNTY